MSEPTRDQDGTGEAVRASLAVVEGAIDLARAEARLALLQTRTSAVSAFVVVLCVFVAVTFVQLTLILVAISPLYVSLAGATSPRPLLVSLGISVGLLVTSALLARAAWHRMNPRKPHTPLSPPEPSTR
jgi:hypothetical protein